MTAEAYLKMLCLVNWPPLAPESLTFTWIKICLIQSYQTTHDSESYPALVLRATWPMEQLLPTMVVLRCKRLATWARQIMVPHSRLSPTLAPNPLDLSIQPLVLEVRVHTILAARAVVIHHLLPSTPARCRLVSLHPRQAIHPRRRLWVVLARAFFHPHHQLTLQPRLWAPPRLHTALRHLPSLPAQQARPTLPRVHHTALQARSSMDRRRARCIRRQAHNSTHHRRLRFIVLEAPWQPLRQVRYIPRAHHGTRLRQRRLSIARQVPTYMVPRSLQAQHHLQSGVQLPQLFRQRALEVRQVVPAPDVRHVVARRTAQENM